ncbi:MAG: hypothetical protein GY795_28820 [Desulfobacterales bacterium]|nr:hypothetical protein [Desulfobacterales bacterium]
MNEKDYSITGRKNKTGIIHKIDCKEYSGIGRIPKNQQVCFLKEKHFKAPTGRIVTAQGNALGHCEKIQISPEGAN